MINGRRCRRATLWMLIGISALIAGCAGERQSSRPAAASPGQTRDLIESSLPRSVTDRAGWTADLIAVIEQESGFRVDPVIPGLAAIAWRERAALEPGTG
jgi:hypothetical protein